MLIAGISVGEFMNVFGERYGITRNHFKSDNAIWNRILRFHFPDFGQWIDKAGRMTYRLEHQPENFRLLMAIQEYKAVRLRLIEQVTEILRADIKAFNVPESEIAA